MEENYKPDFAYADFAADFTAELFDPDKWAEIFKASGARQVLFYIGFLIFKLLSEYIYTLNITCFIVQYRAVGNFCQIHKGNESAINTK